MLIGHSNIKKRDMVIDIGAGSGVITSALAKRCRTVIAVEPDAQAAAKLRQNLQKQGIMVRDYADFDPAEPMVQSGDSKTAKTAKSAKAAKTAKSNTIQSKSPRLATVYLAEKDFLQLDLPECHYKVFANPPFHLSSAIVHRLIEAKNPPDSFYLILQKQFALKLLLTDRHYTSQLGQQLIRQYQTKIKYPLKPTDFTPPPAVPTVLFEAKQIPTV